MRYMKAEDRRDIRQNIRASIVDRFISRRCAFSLSMICARVGHYFCTKLMVNVNCLTSRDAMHLGRTSKSSMYHCKHFFCLMTLDNYFDFKRGSCSFEVGPTQELLAFPNTCIPKLPKYRRFDNQYRFRHYQIRSLIVFAEPLCTARDM